MVHPVRGSRHVHGPARAVSPPSVGPHGVRAEGTAAQHAGTPVRLSPRRGDQGRAPGQPRQGGRALRAGAADQPRAVRGRGGPGAAPAGARRRAVRARAATAAARGRPSPCSPSRPATTRRWRRPTPPPTRCRGSTCSPGSPSPSDAAGSTPDAISLLREVVGMYLKAPAADPEERDLGLARARFHLGRCLLKTGMDEDGLAETEAGLELAADVLDRLQARTADTRLAGRGTPLPAAGRAGLGGRGGRAMTLHAAAGRWQQAATAARTAAGCVRRPRRPRRRAAPRRARCDQRVRAAQVIAAGSPSRRPRLTGSSDVGSLATPSFGDPPADLEG